MDIGRKIKETRKKQNLNQSDLSKMAGIGQDKLSNYENNSKLPSVKTLLKNFPPGLFNLLIL